jgi:hypothetical protein
MTRHLRRWLNDAALRKLGGTYEGIVQAVSEETIRNRFTLTKQIEPVISFDDGWRVVPNITMRRTLIELLGPDTDAWIGERLIVFRQRLEFHDPDTGRTRERWEKRVRKPLEQIQRAAGGSR